MKELRLEDTVKLLKELENRQRDEILNTRYKLQNEPYVIVADKKGFWLKRYGRVGFTVQNKNGESYPISGTCFGKDKINYSIREAQFVKKGDVVKFIGYDHPEFKPAMGKLKEIGIIPGESYKVQKVEMIYSQEQKLSNNFLKLRNMQKAINN